MLNGIDPILLFQFSKKAPSEIKELLAKTIPTAEKEAELTNFPPIPIYLSEALTGVYIDTEDKNIDIETDIATLTTGEDKVQYYQRGLSSTVSINLLGVKDSVGLTLLMALCDLVFPKVTAREYNISYLHGAVTLFGGLLHGFSVNQQSNTTLVSIKLDLIKPPKENKLGPPQVGRLSSAASISP